MRFLIVGASGFIGSSFRRYLQQQNCVVLGTQYQHALPGLVSFDLSQDNILNCAPKTFFDTEETIYVLMLSAISKIDTCFLEKEYSYKLNVTNTIRLFEDLKPFNTKIIYFSSGTVYDGKEGFYNECSPRNPICEYGQQKKKIEDYLFANTTDSMVLRLEKLVSDQPTSNNLFYEWYRAVENQQKIYCMHQVFSPTNVDDIVKAVYLLCEKKLSGAYNICNTERFTRLELARKFVQFAGGNVDDVIYKPCLEFGFADNRLENTFLDSNKFNEIIDFTYTPMQQLMCSLINNMACASQL